MAGATDPSFTSLKSAAPIAFAWAAETAPRRFAIATCRRYRTITASTRSAPVGASEGTMERRAFGVWQQEGLEVVEWAGRYAVQYDAGALPTAWREDEISADELALWRSGKSAEHQTIIVLQRRLRMRGVDPHKQNWERGCA